VSRNGEDALKRSVAIQAVGVALVLVVVKGAVGFLTHSMGILASALDSLMDVFSTLVNYLSIRTAAKPADQDHRYGHGKAESLAAFFQCMVLFASVGYLVKESVERLLEGARVDRIEWGLAVMAFSIVLTCLMAARLRSAARKTKSLALRAEYLHFLPDAFSNLAVFLGLGALWLLNWSWLDPVLSLGISAYLFIQTLFLLRETVDVLMDRELPPETTARIHDVLKGFETEILSFHDLKTRTSGTSSFCELHLVISDRRTFREAHEISERVRRALESEITNLKVCIHADPGADSGHDPAPPEAVRP